MNERKTSENWKTMSKQTYAGTKRKRKEDAGAGCKRTLALTCCSLYKANPKTRFLYSLQRVYHMQVQERLEDEQ